jgi:hypothetical protein
MRVLPLHLSSSNATSSLKECKLRLFKHTQGSVSLAAEQALAKPVLDINNKRTFAQISIKVRRLAFK